MVSELQIDLEYCLRLSPEISSEWLVSEPQGLVQVNHKHTNTIRNPVGMSSLISTAAPADGINNGFGSDIPSTGGVVVTGHSDVNPTSLLANT